MRAIVVVACVVLGGAATPAAASEVRVDSNGLVAAFETVVDGKESLGVRTSTECGPTIPECLEISGGFDTKVTYVESGAQPNDQCLQAGTSTVHCIAKEVGGDLGAGDDFLRGDADVLYRVDGGAGNDQLFGSSAFARGDVFDGGPGNDQIQGDVGDDTISGGAGDDILNGRAGNDVVRGDAGSDRLYGSAGDDTLEGGEGDDQFERATIDSIAGDLAGADVYRGGAGVDALNLQGAPGNRTLTIGTGADDGTSGEGDDIGGDVENVRGGAGNDTLVGDGNANVLIGDAGNDTVRGGAGNDEVNGAEDTDQVFGEAGDDTVRGGSGADMIDGGPGTDVLEADVVGCQNICANGNDTVNARDGIREQVSCGGGADRLIADALDIATQDPGQLCESIERDGSGTTTPPEPVKPEPAKPDGTRPGDTSSTTPTTTPTGGTAVTSVQVVATSLGTALSKGLGVRVPCAASRCTVHVHVRQGRRTLATGRRQLSRGGGTVTARFTPSARRRLARSARVALRVGIRSVGGGSTTTTTKTVTLRRR